MTNRNDFNNDETIDIPDFVEEKTKTDSDIDLSIFKMSDEELYDDSPEETDNDFEELKPKKKNNLRTTLMICIIIIIILLATSIGSIIYGLKQHSNYVKANTENVQLRANEENYKSQINEKDATIAALTEQLNNRSSSDSSTPAGQGDTVYEIVDGPLHFRNEPTTDADEVSYNGKSLAENGEKFKVIEIVNDKDLGGSLKWAKVADNVYFCVEDNGNVYAKKS